MAGQQPSDASSLPATQDHTFRALMELQHDAAFLHPLQGGSWASFSEVNPTALSRYGYSRDELTGMTLADLAPADQLQASCQHQQACEQLLKEGHARFTTIHTSKSGHPFSVEVSSALIELGDQPWIMTLVRDTSIHRLPEESYATLVQDASIGIVLADAETGEIVECNDALAAMIGCNRQELVGQAQTSLHPPMPTVGKVTAQFAEHRDSRSGQTLVTECITRQGRVFPVEIKARRQWFYGRDLMVGFFQDVSERQQNLQQLAAQEEKFRAVMNNQQDALLLHRVLTEGYENFTEVNQAAVDFYGCSREELLDMSIPQIIPPEVMTEHKNRKDRENLLRDGRILLESVHLNRSGERIPVEVSGTLVEFGGDQYILTSVRDIRQRKQAEELIRKSQEQLKTVLESLPADVSVSDRESHEIIFMNQHMIENFGQDLTGQKCWQAFRCYSGPCPNCINNKLLDEQGESTGTHSWDDMNHLTGRYYMNHVRAIQWVDGRMVRLQVATDITELKSLEEQLRQKYKMEAVGVMAGGVAHNFNNNLAIVLGNLELAEFKRDQPDTLAECLDNAKTAVFRSRDLISQILTYSRQGVGSQSAISPTLVINETIKLFTSALPTTVQLNYRTKLTQDVRIKANPNQIQEALLNLCNNAVQAMAEEGELLVQLEATNLSESDLAGPEQQPGPYVRLRVRDNGCGISNEILDKIFDPFFTTKEVGLGTGMGLASVQGIVDQHGGFIRVTSEPARGTTFDLFFPQLSNSSERPEQKDCSTLPRGREKLLFIDDEPLIAELGGTLLGELGYQVRTETDSHHALEIFKADPHTFDLVITDQTMPRLSGLKLLPELRRIRPQMPVILCTGYSSKVSADSAVQLGFDAFCLKPLNIQELAHTVRRVLD